MADRVDRMGDGSVSVVDYKTIKRARKTEQVLADIYNGTSLQLPVYARAAKRRYEAQEATAAYWYLASHTPSRSRRGRPRRGRRLVPRGARGHHLGHRRGSVPLPAR